MSVRNRIGRVESRSVDANPAAEAPKKLRAAAGTPAGMVHIVKDLRVLCYTCGGSGDLEIPRAYLDSAAHKIEARYVLEECWFCNGEGWIPFARRA